tara:strand:- start:498 stop:917 length:420 start_codon:yes stop_codon:yes gene_type:complete
VVTGHIPHLARTRNAHKNEPKPHIAIKSSRIEKSWRNPTRNSTPPVVHGKNRALSAGQKSTFGRKAVPVDIHSRRSRKTQRSGFPVLYYLLVPAIDISFFAIAGVKALFQPLKTHAMVVYHHYALRRLKVIKRFTQDFF